LAAFSDFVISVSQASPYLKRDGCPFLKFRPALENLKIKRDALTKMDISFALLNILWKVKEVEELKPGMNNRDFNFNPRVSVVKFLACSWYLLIHF
jgi:hypothetical protein